MALQPEQMAYLAMEHIKNLTSGLIWGLALMPRLALISVILLLQVQRTELEVCASVPGSEKSS